MPEDSSLEKYLLEIEKYKAEIEKLEKGREQILTKCNMLDTILESLPHPFYIIDVSSYQIKVANDAAGRGKKDSLLTCHELTHGSQSPCTGKEHPCPMEIVKKTGKATVVEHVHYDGKNNKIFVEVYGFPVFDERGELVEMIEYSLDITKRKKAEQKLTHMATHDALTELPNRALFNIRLDLEISHARRNRSKLAVMLVDLDGFKAINDTLGHSAGDTLLRQVAAILKKHIRKSDTVARLGGDEFLVLLPELRSGHDADVIGQKMVEAMQKSFILAGRQVQVGASIGIALYPDDSDDAESLVSFADIAMYAVKAEGGGSFKKYTFQMKEDISKR